MARPEGLTSPTSPVITPVTGLGLTPRDDPRVRLSVAGGTITPRGGCRGREIGLLHRRALHLQMSTVSSATPQSSNTLLRNGRNHMLSSSRALS